MMGGAANVGQEEGREGFGPLKDEGRETKGKSAEQAMIYTLIPSNDRSQNRVCKAKSKLITSTVK